MMQDNNNYKNYDNALTVRKSNALIGAKYKSSLLENKLMAIALSKVEDLQYPNGSKLVARLYPGETNAVLGKKRNIYRELKQASKLMTGRSMVIEDGRGAFTAFAAIPRASYKDGVLEIEFSEELRPHILDLKKNFTTLNLSTLYGFERNTSYRIYELLQKEMYKSNKAVNDGEVVISYNLNEFRFMIGLANSDEARVKKVINSKSKSSDIDWDYLYEHVAIEKMYASWGDLKKRILIPAQKELEEKSDIRFEFEGVRLAGNKIRRIVFKAYPNDQEDVYKDMINKRAKIIEEQEARQGTIFEYEYSDLYEEFVGHNELREEDIEFLLLKAHQDDEVVRTAIKMADRQEHIINYMGWIVSCIENGYAEPIEIMAGSTENANRMNEIHKELEKPSFKEKMWNKTKQKEDFKEFLDDIGMELSSFELIYEDYSERIEAYTDWKVGR